MYAIRSYYGFGMRVGMTDSRDHVAILDDEPEIRRMLADTLEEAGFRTRNNFV